MQLSTISGWKMDVAGKDSVLGDSEKNFANISQSPRYFAAICVLLFALFGSYSLRILINASSSAEQTCEAIAEINLTVPSDKLLQNAFVDMRELCMHKDRTQREILKVLLFVPLFSVIASLTSFFVLGGKRVFRIALASVSICIVLFPFFRGTIS